MADDRAPLNQVKYAGKDFPSIFDSIMRRLKVLYGDDYNDFESTAVAIMLIDLFSYSVSQLAWYLDRNTSDCFLASARTPDAVARIVEQVGYKMRAATASVADMRLTFEAGSIPGLGSIPYRFQFSGPGGLIFETRASTPVDPSTLTYDVAVRQGQTRLLTYTSDGTPNQNFRLPNVGEGQYVAQGAATGTEGSVRGWVDGQEWSENDFLTFDKTDQFEVHYQAVPPFVQFGDGFAGNSPPEGAEIRLLFVVMDGQGGNVPANTITTLVSTLVVQGTAVSFTATNNDRSSGGTPPEPIDEAKKNAPDHFAARDATITLRDYKALVNTFASGQYGAVAQSTAVILRDALDDVEFMQLVEEIQVAVQDHVDLATTEEAAMSAGVATATDNFTELSTHIVILQGFEASILTPKNNDVIVRNEAVAAYASNIGGLKVTVDGLLAEMQAQILLINDGVSDQDEVRVNLETLRQKILSQMDSKQGHVDYYAAQIVALTDVIKSDTDTITLTLTGAAQNMKDVLVSMAAQVTAGAAGATAADAASDNLQGDAAAMQTIVLADLNSLRIRMSELFDADCKSNVVQVPILSIDLDGFYAAPPSGLIRAVQDELDEISEVTQLVEVVSGYETLIFAVITVGAKILPGYVYSEVKAAIEGALDEALKGRAYKQSLTIDELHEVIDAATFGVDYVDIEIAGPVAYIDAGGNLVPGPSRVVTKGSVTVIPIT